MCSWEYLDFTTELLSVFFLAAVGAVLTLNAAYNLCGVLRNHCWESPSPFFLLQNTQFCSLEPSVPMNPAFPMAAAFALKRTRLQTLSYWANHHVLMHEPRKAKKVNQTNDPKPSQDDTNRTQKTRRALPTYPNLTKTNPQPTQPTTTPERNTPKKPTTRLYQLLSKARERKQTSRKALENSKTLTSKRPSNQKPQKILGNKKQNSA